MSKLWRGALAAAAIALGTQSVLAQKMNGCPAGQAMQSSDPSGKNVTCVVVPDIAPILDLIGGLTERDIVGRWSVSGPTSCLQSSRGFNADFSPIVTSGTATIVSQITASSNGTRTFNANGTGSAGGTTQAMTHGATVHGVVGSGPAGGASVSTFDAPFTWRIEPDGTLFIDDSSSIPQFFTAPPSRVGFSVTIENLPPYVGHISKDRRTIVLTHPGMSIETSVFRNPANVELGRTERFCARHRILTRLPD